MPKSNLGRRIVLLVTVSAMLMLVGLGVSGWLAVHESTERVLHERQAVAQATGSYLDYVLRQNLERLDNLRFALGVDIEDSDLEPEQKALHSLYLGSIFDGGVFITDLQGVVLWSEPYRADFVGRSIGHYSPVWQCLVNKKPAISNVLNVAPDGKPEVMMVAPLRNVSGDLVGLAGGTVAPGGRALQEVIRPVSLGQTSYIDVIDEDGTILASSNPDRVLQKGQQFNQNGTQVVMSASLSAAPWSVAVNESASEALAPTRQLAQRFIIFGLASLVIALFLSWGMARSLTRPIAQLSASVKRVSEGDLTEPVPSLGSDEIGELGNSFENMRLALKKSLEEIQQWNKALEVKVEERTRQLEESYREIERKEADRGKLLEKVLSAQEEERKRIARELHDETTQALVGLVMRIEALTPGLPAGELRNTLGEVKGLAVRTIDNVHKIIFDLRPSILDDLGLLPALRWYSENRLAAAGIKSRVEVTGEEKKLPPQIEIALFRVVQEAVTNVIKHAEANNVVLSLEFSDAAIRIDVEDDGKGFDVGAVGVRTDQIQGVGLLGMKERVMLLGGKFDIQSQPGSGTHITVQVALK